MSPFFMTTSGLADANLPAAKVEELGWDGKRVGWAEIAEAAGARKFTYGMTDPSASNSGKRQADHTRYLEDRE
ncbi:hypothetical protein GCM10022267_56450 [Lentzea roselyniae]|uniref:Uncharacterized protein n=1 Tax=Lentzea roselyniae TaxID=531940 RepID=A0ABP7BJW2_9PSEU